jgi:huntingtin-interacting protein 1-related protein
MTDVMIERDRLKTEAERIRGASEEEMARLRKDLQDTKDSLVDMSKNKGSEISGIIARYNAEKEELERLAAVRKHNFFFLGICLWF